MRGQPDRADAAAAEAWSPGGSPTAPLPMGPPERYRVTCSLSTVLPMPMVSPLRSRPTVTRRPLW